MNGGPDTAADQAGTMPEHYTLLHPVQLKRADGSVSETITSLPLHRLNGAAARRALNAREKGTGEFMAACICAVTQLAPTVVDKLDGADFMALGEVATGFFGVSQKT